MWCPSVSLSVWANAWLAGAAAPDDVLDALSLWAPRHSVTAYDSVAAGPHRAAVAGPRTTRARSRCCRRCARRRVRGSRRPPSAWRCRCQVTCAGCPAGTQFQRDAVTAGEAVIVGARRVDRGGFGSRVRVRRTRRRRPSSNRSRPRCRGRCIRVPTRRADRAHRPRRGGVRVALGGPLGRRRARRHSRRRAPTSPIRADSSSRCWKVPEGTGRPTTRRHARCACSRTPPTSTRSSPSAPG